MYIDEVVVYFYLTYHWLYCFMFLCPVYAQSARKLVLFNGNGHEKDHGMVFKG